MFGIPLWAVLGTLAALACAFGDARQIRASVALFANWLILTDYYELTGSQYDVPVNMAVDWLTVLFGACSVDWFLLRERQRLSLLTSSNGQALLVFSFGIGMIFHADWLVKEFLGVSPSAREMQYSYWWRFHYLAWAQAALLAGWMGDGCRRALVRRLGNRRRILPLFVGSALGGKISLLGREP